MRKRKADKLTKSVKQITDDDIKKGLRLVIANSPFKRASDIGIQVSVLKELERLGYIYWSCQFQEWSTYVSQTPQE